MSGTINEGMQILWNSRASIDIYFLLNKNKDPFFLSFTLFTSNLMLSASFVRIDIQDRILFQKMMIVNSITKIEPKSFV